MAKKKEQKENRVKTALFLEPRQIVALKALQQAVGVPVSESIRRAIDMYLESMGKEKK